MVSSEPLPNRCGARVTSKVGLVVSTEDIDGTVDDTSLESVLIEQGAVSDTKEPEYESIREYLHNGFRVRGLTINDVDFDQDRFVQPNTVEHREEGTLFVPLDDPDPYVTHRETSLDGYCEKWPSTTHDSDRCYLHGANSGPDEGNSNALDHGLHAKRSTYFQSLDTIEQEFVEALANSWVENTDQFDRDNTAKVNMIWRCAIDQHRLWNALDEFKDDKLIKEQIVGVDPDTGEPQEMMDEHPINLPYSRLDGDVQSRLDSLGVYDDESNDDSSAESLASALADLANN